jgi:DNA-binding MarR family transcriptional regulator
LPRSNDYQLDGWWLEVGIDIKLDLLSVCEDLRVRPKHITLLETRTKWPFTQRAIVTILQTSDAITRGLDWVLRRHGLTATQYSVLVILRGLGSRGASNSAISQRVIKAKPDVTRLLDRLERRGWIRRERDYRDRRSVMTWITVDGLKLLQLLDPIVQDQNLRPFALMKIAEIRQLVAGLEKVLEALAQQSADHERS